MNSILKQIVADKQAAVRQLRSESPESSLRKNLRVSGERPFREALSDSARINIIAEIKKGSPSRGVFVENFDPVKLATAYAEGGAAAISVITEERHFFGKYEYIAAVKHATGLPVLCKDFIVDEYQLTHAKAMQADAVLLITALHTAESLNHFISLASDVGLDCLVEVHSVTELDMALAAGAGIIGVNNRNLDDFSVSLKISLDLAGQIPRGMIRVAESGISEPDHIKLLRASGYSNFLVGEALVRAPDAAALISELRQA
ncbi:MAG: indole-3-glycerol phosphate synthase TrpC [Candidatus Zixiibacteriota bacterium]|nr:MAG: indole-3-glycerol phosphate synthase TrpC [candidate division Zixibacteria bacterium]